MKLRELFEAPQKRTAVVAFGRMNPPTIGHQKLVEALKSHNGDHYVFLSQTQKPKTDPLAFTDKLRYAKFFFPEITIGHPDVRTPMDMMAMLQNLGYTDIIYVAGSDRVEGFKKLFNNYNGKPDKSGNIGYSFDSIEVVSAGERDPDADGAEGMSASKMRAAAAEGNLEAFTEGTPRPEVAEEMFAAVRQGMGIKDVEPEMAEEAPPGREKQVKALKKEFPDDEGAPYAIAWAQHNKNGKPKKNESNLVLDKGRLRSHIISLIADKIAATDDIDQLAEWLRMIVGKELKARGSRYQISSEDIVEAINMKMSDIVKEKESRPEKIDPLPVPQFPEMPQQEGDLGDGAIARQTKLGMTLSNADGTFLWDASGKPSQWRSPAMAGMSQSHNLKTGVITVRYNNGGLKVTKRFDKDGNSLDAGDVAYGMGDVNRSKNADGSTKDVYSAGAYRLEVTKDANGQSKETYWKHNSKTDRVEVSANEVPADIMASLNQSRG
jgi:hypothetical protein